MAGPGSSHGTRTAAMPAWRAPSTFHGMSSRNTICSAARPSASAAWPNARGSGFSTPVRLASTITSNSFRCSCCSAQPGPWNAARSLVSAPSRSPAALTSVISSTISARSHSCSGSPYSRRIMARVSQVSPTAAPNSAARCAQYCRSVTWRRSICCHSSSRSLASPPIRSSTGRIAGSVSASRPTRCMEVLCTTPPMSSRSPRSAAPERRWRLSGWRHNRARRRGIRRAPAGPGPPPAARRSTRGSP